MTDFKQRTITAIKFGIPFALATIFGPAWVFSILMILILLLILIFEWPILFKKNKLLAFCLAQYIQYYQYYY